MNKLSFILGAIALLLVPSIVASCDDADEGLHYQTTTFPVGEAVWRSDVSAEDRAVITSLINRMVKVEQCQFFMGTQAKNTKRPNYSSSFTQRDTIWLNQQNNTAYWRNLKSKDTLWYNVADFDFLDTVKTKYDTTLYANVYRIGAAWVGPVIQVSMPDYYIGKFEVTQGEWNAVMHQAPTGHYCILPDTLANAAWYTSFGKGTDYPAYNIWYEDAVAFCDTLYAKTNLRFRLPNEAEWECAARGGKYCRGYKYIGTDEFGDFGWVYSNSAYYKLGDEDYGIHKGGEKVANELGLCDMGGNVCEWVANSYYRYGRTDTINPQGKKPLLNGQDTLILRGGSWMQKKYSDFQPSNRKLCIMSTYATEESKQSAFFNCGFRICISQQ